jgi:hypothetical protein
MILPNHPRLRMALKVLLAVTCPAWALLLVPVLALYLAASMFWEAASDIVDGRPSRGLGGGR